MAIWQYRRRARHVAPRKVLGTWHQWFANGAQDGVLVGTTESEDSEVYDENHGYKFYRAAPDSGGNFDLYRTTFKAEPVKADIYRPVGPDRSGLAYSGLVLASDPPVPDISSAKEKAEYNSAKLWNKARPAQPAFEALNAFYELKDVPDMLHQRFSRLFELGGASQLYLAYQFGWKPLFKDLVGFISSHFELKKMLEQLQRDNGKSVRRNAHLKEYSFTNVGEQVDSYGAFAPTFVFQCYDGQPSFIDTYEYKENVWLSGAFKYWLPDQGRVPKWLWTASRLAAIEGFGVTPYRVYKAIPWTWLFDWFSNVGEVLHAGSSNIGERLAADYCYVMCSIEASNTRRSFGRFRTSNSFDTSSVLSAASKVTRVHKSRVTPGAFGPMVSLNELSETQTQILGAIFGAGSRERSGIPVGSFFA